MMIAFAVLGILLLAACTAIVGAVLIDAYFGEKK
jgi:hypothetical protein